MDLHSDRVHRTSFSDQGVSGHGRRRSAGGGPERSADGLRGPGRIHQVPGPRSRGPVPLDPATFDRRHLPGDPDVDLPDYSGPFRPTCASPTSPGAAPADARDERRVHARVGRRVAGRGESASAGPSGSRSSGWPGATAWSRSWRRCCGSSSRRSTSTPGSRRPTSAVSSVIARRRRPRHRVSGPFAPDPAWSTCPRRRSCRSCWAATSTCSSATRGSSMQIVVRHGFDDMFAIAWDIWSAKVLPAVMDLKARTWGSTATTSLRS